MRPLWALSPREQLLGLRHWSRHAMKQRGLNLFYSAFASAGRECFSVSLFSFTTRFDTARRLVREALNASPVSTKTLVSNAAPFFSAVCVGCPAPYN